MSNLMAFYFITFTIRFIWFARLFCCTHFLRIYIYIYILHKYELHLMHTQMYVLYINKTFIDNIYFWMGMIAIYFILFIWMRLMDTGRGRNTSRKLVATSQRLVVKLKGKIWHSECIIANSVCQLHSTQLPENRVYIICFPDLATPVWQTEVSSFPFILFFRKTTKASLRFWNIFFFWFNQYFLYIFKLWFYV